MLSNTLKQVQLHDIRMTFLHFIKHPFTSVTTFFHPPGLQEMRPQRAIGKYMYTYNLTFRRKTLKI